MDELFAFVVPAVSKDQHRFPEYLGDQKKHAVPDQSLETKRGIQMDDFVFSSSHGPREQPAVFHQPNQGLARSTRGRSERRW